MKADKFFEAVYRMRKEQKNNAVIRMRNRAPSLDLQTAYEHIVDSEIERVSALYEKEGLPKFWEENVEHKKN